MATDTGSEIAQYRSGNLEWERKCDPELHEFKFRCLKHLIATRNGEFELTCFPTSFGLALEAKENWLKDGTNALEIQKATETVAHDTSNWWPSNWCFGINAMFCAKSLVLASLDNDPRSASAAQCAKHLILYMSFSAACTKLDCGEHIESTPSENMGEAFDDGISVRGVDCPHIENGDLERIANHAMDSTALNWREKLNEELVELITPVMG